jgi:hypothetical protein
MSLLGVDRAVFPIAHLDHRHRTSLRPSARQHVPVTFLSVTGVTFLSVIYIRMPHKRHYGKSKQKRYLPKVEILPAISSSSYELNMS